MRKLLNRKRMLILAAVLLIAGISAQTAFAYFSAYDSALGQAKMNLNSKTQIKETVYDAGKDILVSNAGETDVIVRVRVFGPDGMTVTAPEKYWKEGNDGFYYYNYILPAGATMPEAAKIEASLKDVSEDVANQYGDVEITVIHESTIFAYSDDEMRLPDGWEFGPDNLEPAEGE